MSRAAEQAVADTASGQNKTFNANAQTSFQGAQGSLDTQQGDVNDVANQVAKFAAANPYGAGGAYQTSVNQATAGTADAASEAAKQAAESAAVRTGQNASAGVAAGQATDQANMRDLATVQAKANADRIGKGADYGAKVLQATSIPASLQGSITGEQGRLAATEGGEGNTALGINEKASEDPSFWDTLGSAYAKAQGTFLGGGNGGKG